MHLQVDGDPHPTVRWSKDGDVLESGKRIKVVAGKGLRDELYKNRSSGKTDSQ